MALSPKASWRPRGGPTHFARWKCSGCARSVFRKARRPRKKRTPASAISGIFHSNFSPSVFPPKALENFTRLLSSLLAAGVSLSRALVILYSEASTPAAAAKWKEIHDLVIDGMPLAEAMAKSPDVFPRVYVAMVQAGETGGFLDVVLAQIADFQSREKELRSKVTSAMLYPTILLFLALGVLTFLLVYFIPNFQKLFQGFGGSLPLLTQMIIAASHIVRSYGLFVLAGIATGVFMIRNWFASEKGRRVWEGTILRLPVVGPLVAEFAMARFCPDARHVARRGRAARAGTERRAEIHRQPDSRRRGFHLHREGPGRRAPRAKPGGVPRTVSRVPCWK